VPHDSTLHFRRADPADQERLEAIDTVAATSLLRVAAIAGWIASGECIVAERADEVIGYAACSKRFFGQQFIEMVMVAPLSRSRGIGRALVAHLSQTFHDEKLFTSTNGSNLVMRHLLQSLDFCESGFIDNLDPDDKELVFYRAPTAAAAG
jgi:GNAT superfamily N-acetyltransferase